MPETTEDVAAWYTLTGLLKTCTEFIHKAIERKETLLVHCDLGIHTSFCIVLAYMMTKRTTETTRISSASTKNQTTA